MGKGREGGIPRITKAPWCRAVYCKCGKFSATISCMSMVFVRGGKGKGREGWERGRGPWMVCFFGDQPLQKPLDDGS